MFHKYANSPPFFPCCASFQRKLWTACIVDAISIECCPAGFLCQGYMLAGLP